MMELRHEKRRRALKTAELLFGTSVLNAVVMDLSEAGLRVMLIAPADVPEVLAVRLSGGRVHVVCRRWQQGLEVGLEVLVAAPSHA